VAWIAAQESDLVDRLPSSWGLVVSRVGPLVFAALPAAFLIGLVRSRVRRGAVADLLDVIGDGAKPGQLRDAIARALRDPSVELLFPLPEAQTYVDVHGRTSALPEPGSGRGTTLLRADGRELAVLVFDGSLVDEPELVAGVGAAARLALENEALQAEVRAQLEEVRSSRARILEAGDAERRRIERNIHDGAQQRLVTLSLAVQMAESRAATGADEELASTLRQVSDELRSALSDLRELARGVHPAVLTRSGLAAAIRSLAERSSIPVRVSDVPSERFEPPVEAAAYFVVSEALANVTRHSGATEARVRVARSDGSLVVEVEDDGVGGADVRAGTGLRGLADRLAVLGGKLRVESPPGAGTRVVAELPCP
jgi:signal transduction histidine kinase